MSKIAERIGELRARIERAAGRAGRPPGEVRLIAVSKTFGAERVAEAAACGLLAFGENRVQEAAVKIPAVRARCAAALEWHLVGQLQRNKAKKALELFSVIHSLDRPELARSLERAAGAAQQRPRVLIQVNLDAEEQKGGASPEDVPALLDCVAGLPHLEPVGLMAIPRPRIDPEAQRPSFARLRDLLERLRITQPGLRELSMGMTADFEVAIEEGATLLRIGTAIFGERSTP